MPLDTLECRDAALLVVDMQSNAHADDAAPAVKTLAERFGEAGIPVIWTVHEGVRPGTGGEIMASLKSLAATDPSRVVRKHRAGAFHETRLGILLEVLGVRSLFVVGADGAGAVDATVREAAMRDVSVVAVTDAIAGGAPARERDADWKGVCETAGSNAVLDWLSEQMRPRTLCYGHMLLFVEDRQRSTDFYVNQLGFTVRPAKPLADGRAFTAFRQGIALVDGREPGHRQVDHLAFEVNDVRGMRERLKAAGVDFFQDLHDGPYGLTVYIADPDGTKVELYETGLTMADIESPAA